MWMESSIGRGIRNQYGALYHTPLRIGPDIAGQLTVQLERVTSTSSLQWTVSALSLVLAMFSYAGAVSISRSQSHRLRAILGRIAHSGQVDDRQDAGANRDRNR